MAIGPIRLLALPSYRSLTNQILIFAILDLNFSLNFDCMQTAFSPCLLSYYVCGHGPYSANKADIKRSQWQVGERHSNKVHKTSQSPQLETALLAPMCDSRQSVAQQRGRFGRPICRFWFMGKFLRKIHTSGAGDATSKWAPLRSSLSRQHTRMHTWALSQRRKFNFGASAQPPASTKKVQCGLHNMSV